MLGKNKTIGVRFHILFCFKNDLKISLSIETYEIGGLALKRRFKSYIPYILGKNL